MAERPILFQGAMVRAILAGRKTQTRRLIPDDALRFDYAGSSQIRWGSVRCPYGGPGDRLWVRETWAEFPSPGDWIYRADHDPNLAANLRWRPSIFMPRAASRITLEALSVRPEQLQEISEEDAIAEGVCSSEEEPARVLFRQLWNKINGKRCPWESNPWVWRIEFRRIEPSGNPGVRCTPGRQ